jgi:cytoskeletal protein RodZ
MGEEVAGLPEALAVGVDAGHAPERIGAYLSRQRRLRGIRLDELARTTCIPLRSLERLESGAFDGTPDGFARGFVRTVALALGLDPDDTVSRMLPEAAPRPRRRSVPLPEPRWPWAGPVLALLGIALAFVWWAEGRSPGSEPADLSDQYVYRRDVVRELAREQAAASRPVPETSQPGSP